MKARKNPDDENIDALEQLSQGTAGSSPPRGKPRTAHPPPATSRPAPPERRTNPPPVPQAPAPHGAAADSPFPEIAAQPPPQVPTVPAEEEVDAEVRPPYRCLHCGYPLASGAPRCAECGHSYNEADLAKWYAGDEERLLDQVIWLSLATLFLRLFVLPELFWIAKLGTAVVIMWAGFTVRSQRESGLGAQYATGCVALSIVMLLVGLTSNTLPFYTLDIATGCLLLLAMLRHPEGSSIASVLAAEKTALVLLFLAPVLALGCWLLDSALAAGLSSGQLSLPTLGTLSIPRLVIPYFAAAAVWLLVWRSLAAVKKLLFAPAE